MSNNKQSCVEWLIEQVKSKEWQDKFIWHKEDVFQQAKAMHKEEMFEYIKQKYCIGQMSLEFHTLEFEQYYNEHYGK